MKKQKAATKSFYEQNIMPVEEEIDLVGAMDQEMVSDFDLAPEMERKMAAPPVPTPKMKKKEPVNMMKTSEELQLERDMVPVRETGFGIWKRIIVPPNAYVVHTRMNRKKPVTLGLGISFRFNPYKDSYIVVPAAMQTIGVVANCISKEKQGINVLAYVQWQIDDFSVAYKKLDFSNTNDPLGIVNAQLREQAEAAIKDKISTMSVEEVLTDKAPVIEELTSRLSEVAEEGRKSDDGEDKGLGIKIVTVQIREALVSSKRLWEDLQAPFRHQQDKIARISQLSTQNEIQEKELSARQQREISEAETMVEIERIKQNKETEATNLKLAEESLRFNKQQETLREKIELEEKTKAIEMESEKRIKSQESKIAQESRLKALEMESEANRKKLEQDTKFKEIETTVKISLQKLNQQYDEMVQEGRMEMHAKEQKNTLELKKMSNEVKNEQMKKEAEIDRERQEINNIINNNLLLKTFFDKLPEIAQNLPEIEELKVLQTGGNDSTFDFLSAFATKAMALAENLGIKPDRSE